MAHRKDHKLVMAGGRMVVVGAWGMIGDGAHPRTQSLIAAAGGVVTGVLLAHIPAETEYRGIQPAGGASRFACVVCYQALATAPSLRVYLPDEVAGIAGPTRAALCGGSKPGIPISARRHCQTDQKEGHPRAGCAPSGQGRRAALAVTGPGLYGWWAHRQSDRTAEGPRGHFLVDARSSHT